MTPWKNFPREMLLLGDDMKEWMEEDGQAEKENIPSSKRMKSDHSKISALDPENVESLVFLHDNLPQLSLPYKRAHN